MIRLAEESDIEAILPHLRAQEATTIARLRLDPAELLRKALGPFAFTGLVRGDVACMWGISFAATLGTCPRLWLVTTPLVEKNRLHFLRESRRFVDWARAEYGIIEGCVDCANTTSRRWLEWLGFHPVEETSGYMWMRTNGD